MLMHIDEQKVNDIDETFWSTQRIIYPFRRNINIRAHKFLAVKSFYVLVKHHLMYTAAFLEGYFYDNLIAL